MFSRLAGSAKRAASKSWLGPSVLGGLYAAGGAAGYAVYANDDALHPVHLHWPHSGVTDSLDTAAIRRGYEVYRQVCSTCHSMDLIKYRNLVGVSHTSEQIKALAGSFEIKDGPDAEGEYYDRPGKPSDAFPRPYPNDEAGRAANAGALPPDLSCISKARKGGEDYVFALLTGYGREQPEGFVVGGGLHFNPYFTGAAIAMSQPLSDGQVEYEDDTEATVSQMARDVSTFLSWASEPEQDERKFKGCQWFVTMATAAAIAGYYKRFQWASTKTRRISWID